MSVFGRSVVVDGGFRGEDAAVVFSPGGVAGSLVRNLSLQFNQPISRIWDLTTGHVFLISGRPEGNASMAKVAGPGSSAKVFAAWNVCNRGTMTISAKSGFCSGKGANWSLRDCVPTSITASVSSDDMIMHEGVAIMFMDMDIGD